MHNSWQPTVELADGMVLGAGTWLDAIARNADLGYGFAHRPEAPFAQSWMEPPGQGEWVAWEGETRYDGAQTVFEFSAWVELPDPVGTAYAKLQLWYDDQWNTLVTDTAAGAHWFDDAHDTDGVISNDIAAYYTAGEVVLARLVVNGDGGTGVTSAWTYRALLSGATGFPTWPTWPEWTDATPHDADDFNTLRTAAAYLKECCERTIPAQAVATVYHTQNDAVEEIARWSFRKAGPGRIQVGLTTTDCDATRYVRVWLAEEQDPHGPGSFASVMIGEITSDTTTTVSYDISALTTGQRYAIILVSYRQAIETEPRATINSIHIDDLGSETRANVPPVFSFGDQPDAATIEALADDLEDMKPDAASGSPLWPEHVFSSYRPFNRHTENLPSLVTTYRIDGRRWGLLHTFDYLRYRGAGRIVSADGQYNYTLSDSNPSGSPMVFELKSLTWLAKGDWYAVEDTGTLNMAYEDWEG